MLLPLLKSLLSAAVLHLERQTRVQEVTLVRVTSVRLHAFANVLFHSVHVLYARAVRGLIRVFFLAHSV